jgi:hypothetical protein
MLLAASPAFGVEPCPSQEYAEIKDMKKRDLVYLYCHHHALSKIFLESSQKSTALADESRRDGIMVMVPKFQQDAMRHLDESTACSEQAFRILRILVQTRKASQREVDALATKGCPY